VKIDPSVSQNIADLGTAKDNAARAQNSAAAAAAAANVAPTNAQASSAGTSGDVSLSPLSSTLRSGGTNVGDIDVNTVQQIKDAISKGQLPIDTSKIADGLIDSVRSFLKTS
jgi:negative regulator of flagellin synthesis FlgM